MAVVDLMLFAVYGAVSAYFVRRWWLFRRWPSLGVALLPSGWLVLALEGPLPENGAAAVKWVGVGVGVLLLALVTHADRQETK